VLKKNKTSKKIKTSSRRKFIKTAVATTTVAASITMPNVSLGAPVTLKMQAAWQGKKNIFFEMAKDYEKRVNEMAGGSMKLEVLPRGAIVEANKITDAVSEGVVDAGHTATVYWYNKNNAAILFGGGPTFGFSSQELIGWIEYGGGRAYLEKIFRLLNLDIISFFAMPAPAQSFGWFQEHTTKISEITGMKYRTSGMVTDILSKMGMIVRKLSDSEIEMKTAMETGLIEGSEFNNPTLDKDFGMQEISKHYHLGSYYKSIGIFELEFNKTKFNNLEPHHQAILRYAAESVNSDNYWKAIQRYSTDLIKLTNDHRVNIYKTSEEILLEQLKAWDIILAEKIKDPLFKEIVESQKIYCKKVMKYLFLNQPDYRLAYKHAFGEPSKVKI
jgi:TRAP-type mannitol/chloroaromatic compound transport system substrate-binding protein|tara:strand:+ start:500 stop:1657 length:1158 start_codon:yes stop_codon:yes gene_type:complete